MRRAVQQAKSSIQENPGRWSSPNACACMAISALGVVAVALCLFYWSSIASSSAHRQMNGVWRSVQTAKMVQFAVKAANNGSDGGSQGTKTRAWWDRLDDGCVAMYGQLFPRQSNDSGRLGFDGWIRIEFDTNDVRELLLWQYRGYELLRTPRPQPDGGFIADQGCLSTADLPPLHAVDAAVGTAFEAQDFDSFHVQCHAWKKPVEIVFDGVPFVVCAGDTLPALIQPQDKSIIERQVGDPTVSEPSNVTVYGEQVQISAVVLSAEDLATTQTKVLDAPEIWSNRSVVMQHKCEYLEAPMTTGSRLASFVYTLRVRPPAAWPNRPVPGED